MTTDGHTIPNYMAIFWWLLALTILEVGWALQFHNSAKLLLAGGIVAFAIIKAVLVALYFMHLKFERRTMGILFASTLILGMITTHSPEVLNLVLVDFKGGATFPGLDRIRHVSAIITNLADEAHLVARMRDDIDLVTGMTPYSGVPVSLHPA